MKTARFLACLAAALSAALASPLSAAVSVQLDRGTLPSGASYAALKPSNWDQRRQIFVLPVQRPADEGETPAVPPAELDLVHPLVRSLLEDGWFIATLNYRRGGVVLRDSMEDVERLREHLAATHGVPGRLYLLGDGLGGAVAVRVVENYPDYYAGALAVGGAFDLTEPGQTIGVNFAPQRPLLLLPNQGESHAPNGYVRAAAAAPVPPVLWRIVRDGRSNTNVAEKLAALAALVRWVDEGRIPPPNFDATIAPPEHFSEVEFSADGTSATASVTGLNPLRGDLTINLQPHELERLGVTRGAWFTLELGTEKPRTVRALYGVANRSSTKNDWMAIPEAEGWMLLSVHRGNAAAVSGLKPGDKVTIRRRGR